MRRWTTVAVLVAATAAGDGARGEGKAKRKAKAAAPAAAVAPAPKAEPAPKADEAAPDGEAECQVDIVHLPRKLAEAHADFDGPVKVQRSTQKGALVETVKLRDGRTLIATQGGCTHFTINLELTPIADATKLTDRGHWLEVAATLLERKLSPKEEPLDDLDASILRLAAPTANVKPGKDGAVTGVALQGDCNAKLCTSSLPCGDATCSVEVRRLDPKRATLRFLYDFPL